MKKDCCHPQPTKIKAGFHLDPFVVWIGVITLTILGGVIYFGSKMGATPKAVTKQNIQLAVNSKSYDWGVIDYDNGIVSQNFAIKNTSSTTLELYDIATSCMCTTAQLITPNKTSRKFAMHDKSSSIFEVNPGETAELKIEFDPTFHGPSGLGPVTRTVTMNTNDAANPQLIFKLTGQVVKK